MLNGSENWEVKYSNICVGRGESQTKVVNQSLSIGKEKHQRWKGGVYVGCWFSGYTASIKGR